MYNRLMIVQLGVQVISRVISDDRAMEDVKGSKVAKELGAIRGEDPIL